jgi:hypothetical protein
MYISNYLMYKLFPDKRNIALPAITNILSLKERPQVFAIASFWAAIFALLSTGFGVFGWSIMAERYKAYHLDNFGHNSMSVIIGSGHTKGLGTYMEYEYADKAGKLHRDRFANKHNTVGDSIVIRFSTKRPVINSVVDTGN